MFLQLVQYYGEMKQDYVGFVYDFDCKDFSKLIPHVVEHLWDRGFHL